MNLKKSQTATEYLIILAVVIIIALIVVGVLGGIPSIGGGASESTARVQLASLKVAILNYKQDSHSTLLKFRNNNPSSIRINEMWVADKKCTLYPYRAILKPGESKSISCYGVVGLDENSRFEYDFNLTYTDLEINAQYAIEPDVKLVGTVADGSELHTGQTTCSYCPSDCGVYGDESRGLSPSCDSSHVGQDGYDDGTPKSFTDLGDNVLKDNHIGLYWTTNRSVGAVTLAEANADCAARNTYAQGGFTDWRLPNIVELTTVMNSEYENPSPEQSWAPGYYWSSTNQTVGSTYYWRLYVQTYMFEHDRTTSSVLASTYSVCVRGTTRSINLVDTSKNFVDVGDGTIVDIDTGIIWEKEVSTPDLTLYSAFIHCNSLNKSGYTDWRLPTVSEATMLMDFGSDSSSNYYPDVFDSQDKVYLRTGTTPRTEVYEIYPMSNGVNSGYYEETSAVRCVRDR